VYNPIGAGILKDHHVCGQYCQADYNCFSYQYTPNTDGAGECLIYVKQWYIGNVDSGAEATADHDENVKSFCHVRKTYYIYESRMMTDRHGLPRLPAFGIQRDYPVSKGSQDTVYFYFASKDSYDTSV
jgi:hypothetical protein